MARRKYHFNTNRPMSPDEVKGLWADDYSNEYEPSSRKLHQQYKVPKFKREVREPWRVRS
jgi:hypothetical protein